MKALITSLFVVLSIGLFAQDPQEPDSLKPVTKGEVSYKDGKLSGDVYTVDPDSTRGDTTRIELNNAYITIISKGNDDDDDCDDDNDHKYELTWWNGIDLGINGILGENHDFQLGEASFLEPNYGSSRYISFNMAQVKLNLVKNYVGLTTGLSFQFYNYKYSGGTEFIFRNDSLLAVPSGDKNITKNKLRAIYFAVPLMLEFNTSLNPQNVFHISVGVIGKVKLENMYKQKYDLDGNSNKATLKGDMGFNLWGLDATARIGYRRLTLFAQVGLEPFIKNANTPDVYTFATGFFIKI